jgi:hypothetical protein
MPRSSQLSLTFRPPNQNPVNTSPLPHVCHMSCPPHPPSFNHPNNIQWRMQAMKFIIILHNPSSSLLGPNILLSTLFSKNPQSIFLPQSVRPSFVPIQHNQQNYNFVYFTL